MLQWAVQRELIADNPLRLWKPIKGTARKSRHALRPEEAQRLLTAAPRWRRVLYMTMLASGIRKGEAVRLVLDDLDTHRSLLIVRPEIAKTVRWLIPLPPALVARLAVWLAEDLPKRAQRQRTYLETLRARLSRHEGNGKMAAPRFSKRQNAGQPSR